MLRLFIARLQNRLLRRYLKNRPLNPVALRNLKVLDHLDGFRPARSYSYVVVDLETTGLDLNQSRVISIGAVRVKEGRIHLDRIFNQLVNPGRYIPPKAIKVHGIMPEMVKSAPLGPEAIDAFLEFLGSDILVAHSAAFDINFINRLMLGRHGFTLQNLVIDTRSLYWHIILPKTGMPVRQHPKLLGRGALNPGKLQKKYSLDEIAHHLGIKVYQRHTAVGDALATAMIFQHSLSRMENAGKGQLNHLIKAGSL